MDCNQEARLVKLRQNETNSKLGFSLRGGKEATGSSVGVFVSHVEQNGEAFNKGLKLGDQVIQVNGLQVSQATYDEVIGLIRRTPKSSDIRLMVKFVGQIPVQEKSGEPIRWISTATTTARNDLWNLRVDEEEQHHHQRGSMNSSGDSAAASSAHSLTFSSSSSVKSEEANCLEEAECLSSTSSSSRLSTSSGCSISISSAHSSQASLGLQSDVCDTPVRVPGGRSTSDQFGCGVVKGPDEWPGIFVQTVKPDSLAERVGLQPGDQLVQADGHLLADLSFEAAIALIKQLQHQQQELLLLVRKGAALRHLASCRQQRLSLNERPPHSGNDLGGEPAKVNDKTGQPRQVVLTERDIKTTNRDNNNNNNNHHNHHNDDNYENINDQEDDEHHHKAAKMPQAKRQKANRTSDLVRQSMHSTEEPNRWPPVCSRTSRPATLASFSANQLESKETTRTTTTTATDKLNGGKQDKKSEPNSISHSSGTENQQACNQQVPRLAKREQLRDEADDDDDHDDLVGRNEQQQQQRRRPRPPRPGRRISSLINMREQLNMAEQHLEGEPLPACTGKGHQDDEDNEDDDDDNQSLEAELLAEAAKRNAAPEARRTPGEEEREEDNLEHKQGRRHLVGVHQRRADEDDDKNNGHSAASHQHRPQATLSQSKSNNNQARMMLMTAKPSIRLMFNQENRAGRREGSPFCDTTSSLAKQNKDTNTNASNHQQDDEQHERIRIVRQNCKLHHHSHAIKSHRFAQTGAQVSQQAQTNKPPPATRNNVKTLQPNIRRIELCHQQQQQQQQRTLQPNRPNPMQRYISMDNLNLSQTANSCQVKPLLGAQNKRPQPPRPFSRQEAPKQAYMASSQQVGNNGPVYATPVYRRSTSVLGQPMGSCCPSTFAVDDLTLVNQHLSYMPPGRGTTTCACLTATMASSRGCTAKGYSHLLINQPTANRRLATNTGMASLATLSRFKAQSEDKLNLMHLNYVKLNQIKQNNARYAGQSKLSSGLSAKHRFLATRNAAAASSSSSSATLNSQLLMSTRLLLPECCSGHSLASSRAQQQVELAAGRLISANHQHRTLGGRTLGQRKPLAATCCSGQNVDDGPAWPTSSCSACCCCPLAQSPTCCEQSPASRASQRRYLANGASTDSSGYQSGASERPVGRLLKTCGPLQANDTQSIRQQRISTFLSSASPAAATTTTTSGSAQTARRSKLLANSKQSGRLVASKSVTNLMSVCRHQQGSSATCSPLCVTSSDVSPSASSPSPTRHGLASLSTTSCVSSSSTSSAMSPTSSSSSSSSSPPPPPQPKQTPKATSKQIPRPPPMPLADQLADQTESRRPSAGKQTPKCRQDGSEADDGSSGGSDSPAGKSYRLCFVDELKMLARRQKQQQQQQSSGAGSGTKSGNKSSATGAQTIETDSSTLIKIINASKSTSAATAANKRPDRQSIRKTADQNKCRCGAKQPTSGAPSDCQVGGKAASKCCCLGSSPSKSVKLKDEQDNMRRQHEMLMKEFKSAHSKMFSKLRANSKEQQQQQQQHGHQQQTTDGHDNDNDDDHDDGDDDSDDQHCQVANGTDKNNNGGQQLIIRPMARTGC